MTGGMPVENRTEPAMTCKVGKATVRIYAGKMTKEELQAAFTEGSRKMRKEMERGRRKIESA